MLTPDSPLERAIERITISDAWYRLRIPGEPKKLCCSPLRNDRTPSFSIYNDDRLFKDFGTGEKGNVVRFVSMATGLDKTEASRLLIEWNGGNVFHQPIRRSHSPVRPSQHFREDTKKERKELVIPDIDRGSIEELTKLRVSRLLPCFAALERLNKKGLFGFCYQSGIRCWMLTDVKKKNAQVRPLEPTKAGWSMKSKTLLGANADWPIGSACISESDMVFLTEGTPDLLAVATAAYLETDRDTFNRLGFCCMTGANQKIAREALPLFEGKHVRLVVHNDEPGKKACHQWAKQLLYSDCNVDQWISDRAGEDFNDWASRNWLESSNGITLPEKLFP